MKETKGWRREENEPEGNEAVKQDEQMRGVEQ